MATEVEPESPSSSSDQETSYLFVKVLGRGAFGEAVLYSKTEDNTLVVWKEVNLSRLGEKEKSEAQREVDILSLLNHANIITYFNHFLDKDTLFIEIEYANGGTLYNKIAEQKELFAEDVVRWYLFQMTSALAYIHDLGIIHRDMKTMNVFMTKSDLLKLGDFGISKMLESQSQMAETVVGTPYYMSPEIVQGDRYDRKVDIWALGCILFELLTLTRTFEATNQLRLAYEIVKGEYGDIDSKYSKEIQELVKSMLQKESSKRPTSDQVLEGPVLGNFRSDMEQRVKDLNSAARRAARLQSSQSLEHVIPVITSKTSEAYQWGGGKLVPQKQDIFVKGRSAVQVAAGHGHFAVVTVEKELYTWANVQGGTEIVGQLGQGNKSAYKAPKKVEALEGVGVIQVSCGEDFTLCVTDEGNVHAFGSDYYGCLGCDNVEGDEVLSPILVNFFSNLPVAEVSCGDNHVVALTKDQDVYTWGCGEFGRLGLGSEDDFATPQKVKTPGKHLIKHVCAGSDGTFLVTTTGRVLACGSNEHNKLGLNSETSGLRKRKLKSYDIPCRYTFITVKPLVRYNVESVSAGKTHSAVIDLYGHLLTFGSNKYGQLGVGDFKHHAGICRIGGILTGKRVENATCGDGFTVVSTNDNQVYSWGNGANGRLGTDFSDQGKGPNNKCTALPRAIFGSLHVVSNLSARHWHTIVIAEKVLNQKTLKLRMSSPKLLSAVHEQEFPDDVSSTSEPTTESDAMSDPGTPDVLRPHSGSSCEDSNILTGNRPRSSEKDRPRSGGRDRPPGTGSFRPQSSGLDESAVPDWLKDELQDAEFIPIPQSLQPDSPGIKPIINTPPIVVNQAGDQSQNGQNVDGKDSKVTNDSSSQDTGALIATLMKRIEVLEKANSQLTELLQSKDQRIQRLEQQLGTSK